MLERINRIEAALLASWQLLVSAQESGDGLGRQSAVSRLAHGFSYLLNFYLSVLGRLSNWQGYGTDDLLESHFITPTPNMLHATGLMVWGTYNDNCERLTPFECRVTFDRNGRLDYIMGFAAASPEDADCTIPFTRNSTKRHKLLSRCVEGDYIWPLTIRRSELEGRG